MRQGPSLLLAAAISAGSAAEMAADRNDRARLPDTPDAARSFDYCSDPIDAAGLSATLARLDRMVENVEHDHSGDAVATALLRNI